LQVLLLTASRIGPEIGNRTGLETDSRTVPFPGRNKGTWTYWLLKNVSAPWNYLAQFWPDYFKLA